MKKFNAQVLCLLLLAASIFIASPAGAMEGPPVAPEPVSSILFGVGAATLWLRRKFKNKK